MNKTLSLLSNQTDLLIIGSGAAGLTLALRSADFAQVTVLSKGDLREGAKVKAERAQKGGGGGGREG
mgnify:CR=1 FL=1